MSQYNKTVLTNAGLELAKRANAGQARFEITRAVTSADDWSNKTIQDIEAVTTIPNIMQQGTIMDTEEVESNNSVMGVSLCFTNKNLSAGYQIKIIGVYVKEEGQENDFLYAVTTAVAPEYMPDFSDKVLYRFNMQLYLVIGKTQAVNVIVNDGASVTHGQFDKYKGEVTASLEKIENAHKEDMSHVVKSASINGGDEILPNETGKLELVVPDPDLSKYVSLEQLTETLKSKADITAIPDKTATEEGIKQAKELAQEADTKAQNALDNKADKTTVEENLATKANQSDLDKTNAEVAKKANSTDVYTKSQVDGKLTTVGTVKTVDNIQPDSSGNVQTDHYTKAEVDNKIAPLGTVKKVAGISPNDDGNVPIKIGGTNLAHGTILDLSGADKNYGNTKKFSFTAPSDSNWNYATIPLDISFKKGDIFTISFDSTLTGSQIKDGWIKTTIFNKDVSVCYDDNQDTVWIKAGNRGSKTIVVNADSDPSNPPMALVYAGIAGSTGGNTLTVENFKIERGNIPTDYSLPLGEISTETDITDLQNQIQQLRDNQFEVQTFTDATAAANWESQRPGKRMAIVNS